MSSHVEQWAHSHSWTHDADSSGVYSMSVYISGKMYEVVIYKLEFDWAQWGFFFLSLAFSATKDFYFCRKKKQKRKKNVGT